jgi:hypothetical protein
MNEVDRINILRLASSLFLAVFALTTLSAPTDGETVPIYPNTHYKGDDREPINEKAVTQAIKDANTVSIYTSDSPETVDRWYTHMLPKCARTVIDGAHVYRHLCATRTVNISPSQGQTSINMGPSIVP